MKWIYKKLTIALILLSLAAFPQLIIKSVVAQSAIQVIDQAWEADFRDHISFSLKAESPTEIVEVDLFYRIVGQLATSRNEAQFTPGTAIEARFEIDQIDPTNYLPPGAELEYWWKMVDAAGNELKTERELIAYGDNRFEWESLQSERVTLYWYEGNESFGQALFERANEALDTLETDIGITLTEPIKIFIYANHRDLLSALSVTAQEWTGGVAYTEHGVVVIGINPSQLAWGLNAMTHEMSHLVIHQATDNPFSGLPRWLDEGIAVYNENRDQLDQDFRPLFERAVADDQLMTLRTLTSPFPADPLLANLAYGQSGATVKFIVDTYGSEAMAELLAIFSEGAIYDEALEQALGVDTDGLYNAHRASLGLPPLPGTETSQGETRVAEETDSQEEAIAESEGVVTEDTLEETVTEGAVEMTAESDETGATAASSEVAVPTESERSTETAPEEAQSRESVLAFLPCIAGILALIIMGAGFSVMRLK